MTLRKLMERQGQLLFRYRSHLPLLIVPLLLASLPSAVTLEYSLGDADIELWRAGCVLIALIGLAIRCAVVGYAPAGTSGRNTREQRADQLNTTGVYSTVRHPLYLGNFVMFVGFVLAVPVWWFVLICCLAYVVYYERIMLAEENFLCSQYGEQFEAWAAKTPTVIPNPRLWVPSDRAFSWRRVLRQEYHAIGLIAVVFIVIEWMMDVLLLRESLMSWVREDWVWLAGSGVAVTAFLMLRLIKRGTAILDLPRGA